MPFFLNCLEKAYYGKHAVSNQFPNLRRMNGHAAEIVSKDQIGDIREYQHEDPLRDPSSVICLDLEM